MLPGSRAPTSAWWARLAANPISSPSWNSGEITVMSGRWVPPRYGSLRIQASPGRVLLAEHRRHRGGHRAEVHGDVLGLHDHLALGVEQGGGGVAALLDVRRVRRAHQHRAHLVAGRAQRAEHAPAA